MEYNRNMNDETINRLNEFSSGDMGTFMQNYRAALGDQYTADVNALENQRKLDQTKIMSGANARGMLHSTFPIREKLKYDVATYEPQLIKLRQGSQTGIDTLYNNAVKYYNQAREYQEKIADLNEV